MKEISALFQKLTINQKFKEVKAKQDIYAYRIQFKIYTIFTSAFLFICLVTIGILFFLNQKANAINHKKNINDSFISSIEEELKATKENITENSNYIPSI